MKQQFRFQHSALTQSIPVYIPIVVPINVGLGVSSRKAAPTCVSSVRKRIGVYRRKQQQSLLLGSKTMSVYQALQPTRFLPSLASAAPYSLSRSFIKFSRFGQIWALIQMLIFATLIYVNRGDIPTNITEIKTLLLTSTSYLQYFIAVFSILKDGFCQKNMIEVVRSMENYDTRTGYGNDEKGKRENERVRFWSFAYSAILVVMAVGRYFAWKDLGYYIVMEILTMQIDNSIYMFVVFTSLLGLRLRHLNTIIDETRVTIVQEKGVPKSSDPANPEYVRALYTSLVAIGERLNDHYSDRLFLWSAQIMLGLLTRIYCLLTENVSTLFVAATIVQLLPVLLGLLFFSIACEFTTNQANKTISVLLEKNIRHTARIDRGRKEIFTMTLYMALRPFEFSALGFFCVDCSLTYSVVTVTITYLILCIQSGGS